MAPDSNKEDTLKPKEAVKIPIVSHDETERPATTDTPKDDLAKLNESVHPAVDNQKTSNSDEAANAMPSLSNPSPATAAASTDVPVTPAQPTVTSSPLVGGIVSGSNNSGPITFDPTKKKGRFGKRALVTSMISVLLVVGLGAGYVFGFYIPNKPENVWAAAMTNSGKAYDMLTEYATKDKAVKAIQVDGSYKMTGAVASDGSFSGTSNGEEGQLTGSFSAGGLKLGLDVRALKSSTDTPDLYFKLTGLQGLGSLMGGGNPAMAQTINGLNDQWFVVDHSLFAQLNASASKLKFTKQDIQEFLKAVGAPTKDRLFSSDTTKAVFVVKDTVGAETKDGRNTYHYKVGYDTKNLSAYSEALCTSVRSTKIGELMFKSQGKSACDEAAKADIPASNKTADVWVDKRTKLIHVVRISNEQSYVELSQDFQGGDEMPFGVKVHSEANQASSSQIPYGTSAQSSGSGESDVTLSGTLNKAKNTLDLSGKFNAGGGKLAGEFKLAIKPSDKTTLQIDKPKDAKNVLELLNSLGLGGMLGTSGSTPDLLGVEGKAQDTERRTDLAMLTASMTEYMTNNNGKVPTLAQLNDSAWLKQNMPTLDKEALRDPQGTSYKLAASPAAKSYALVSKCSSSASCRDFSFVAILSDGKQYKVDY